MYQRSITKSSLELYTKTQRFSGACPGWGGACFYTARVRKVSPINSENVSRVSQNVENVWTQIFHQGTYARAAIFLSRVLCVRIKLEASEWHTVNHTIFHLFNLHKLKKKKNQKWSQVYLTD